MPRAAQPPGSDANEHAQDDQVVPFPRSPKEQEQLPPHHNLHLELTSFVGRQRKIAQVKESLLLDHRLLTLTGPGGCGKTRLALAVAFEVAKQFEDGVWLVELASLPDPELVPQALASVLEVNESPGYSLTEGLIEHLRSKKMLLILDNCEHLIVACAALAEVLLHACPALRILATSREVLGVTGESVRVVPSLLLPDISHLPPVEDLWCFEAICLFAERA